MLYRLGKIRNRLFRVAVLDALPDTMVQMTLQNDLPHLMQGAFCGVDLDEDLFTGDVLIHHFVDGFDLPQDLVQPSVQIIAIHTFAHNPTSFIPIGV